MERSLQLLQSAPALPDSPPLLVLVETLLRPMSKSAALLALVLLLCLCLTPVTALKRKNRVPNGGKVSLFNPFIVLDEEDQRDLGRAGLRFAHTHKIVGRNPILLVPGM